MARWRIHDKSFCTVNSIWHFRNYYVAKKEMIDRLLRWIKTNEKRSGSNWPRVSITGQSDQIDQFFGEKGYTFYRIEKKHSARNAMNHLKLNDLGCFERAFPKIVLTQRGFHNNMSIKVNKEWLTSKAGGGCKNLGNDYDRIGSCQ